MTRTKQTVRKELQGHVQPRPSRLELLRQQRDEDLVDDDDLEEEMIGYVDEADDGSGNAGNGENEEEEESEVADDNDDETSEEEYQPTSSAVVGPQKSLNAATQVLDASSTVFNPEQKPIPTGYSAVPLSLDVDTQLSTSHPSLGKFTALINECVQHRGQRPVDQAHLKNLTKAMLRVNLLTFHPLFVSVRITTFYLVFDSYIYKSG